VLAKSDRISSSDLLSVKSDRLTLKSNSDRVKYTHPISSAVIACTISVLARAIALTAILSFEGSERLGQRELKTSSNVIWDIL